MSNSSEAVKSIEVAYAHDAGFLVSVTILDDGGHIEYKLAESVLLFDADGTLVGKVSLGTLAVLVDLGVVVPEDWRTISGAEIYVGA